MLNKLSLLNKVFPNCIIAHKPTSSGFKALYRVRLDDGKGDPSISVFGHLERALNYCRENYRYYNHLKFEVERIVALDLDESEFTDIVAEYEF